MSRMKQLKEWITGNIAAHPERQVNKHFLIELFGVIDYIDSKSEEDGKNAIRKDDE